MVASEAGVKNAIAQYQGDFRAVEKAVKNSDEEDVGFLKCKTITQDSPISRHLPRF